MTIKTPTIDRREVTLATFRQGPERGIFDEQANLCGVPWGRVNSCPGNTCTVGMKLSYNATIRPHDHIIWQDDDVLYRCQSTEDPFAWSGWDAEYENRQPNVLSAPLPEALRTYGVRDTTVLREEIAAHIVTRAWPAMRRAGGQYHDRHIEMPVVEMNAKGVKVTWHSRWVGGYGYSADWTVNLRDGVADVIATGRNFGEVEVPTVSTPRSYQPEAVDYTPADEPIDLREQSEAALLRPITETGSTGERSSSATGGTPL